MPNEQCVYLVGAGPGDPDLLTVKALKLIQSADVVIIDRLVSPEIKALIPEEASIIYVGKAAGMHCVPQDEINGIIVKMARSGQKVVRLKGGDPFIFGRGSEEAEVLATDGITFEVVPGISAASGCSSACGIPLTHRGLATGVRYVTGHRLQDTELDLNWSSLACADTTLVIYMGLANIGTITEKLMEHGLPADIPAAAIEKGTTAEQRTHVTTVGKLAQDVTDKKFVSPTIFVIGKVVSVAEILGRNPVFQAGLTVSG